MLTYSVLRRCLLLACISFAGALLVALGLNQVLESPPPALDMGPGAFSKVIMIVGTVVLSPFVEALLLGWLFKNFSRRLSPRWSAMSAGTLFAAAQSAFYGLWGLVVWFPSLVFATPFLCPSRSLKENTVSSALIHMFHNAMGIALILAL